MAVTGVFTADFSSFDKAVQTSTKNLEGLETGAAKTNSSLRLMSQTQEQMLDKIGASGGKIQDLGASAETTGGQVNTLSQSYRQFDGALQAAGINIGPQVKGLEDLANAAGKSATQFGLLGTAGLVVGTAMAAWKVGTWIGEVTGATQAIEDLTAKMLGLGNLTEETAAAQRDTMNRAIDEGARGLKTYAEAVAFLTEKGKVNAAVQIDWREKLADAHREVRNLTDTQKAEIAIAIEAGAITEQLTLKYGIHAKGLAILATETDKAAAAQARLNAERAKDLDAADKRKKSNEDGIALMERDAELMADRAAFDAAEVEALNQKRAAGAGWMRQVAEFSKVQAEAATFASDLADEQARLDQENAAIVESWGAAGAAAVEATTAATTGAQQATVAQGQYTQAVELTSDGIKGWIELMKFTDRANAILKENSLFTTSGQLERIAAMDPGGTLSAFAPSFASGVENFGGGLAKVHGGEVLANLPAGTSVFPKGSGLGAQISNVFNLVDSESNLARRVADLIMRQVRAGTQLGTA